MALIGKAGQLRDGRQWRMGVRQVPAGQGDALAANVITDGAAEVAAERAAQVARMDVRLGGEIGEREGRGAALGKPVAHAQHSGFR